MFLGPRFGEGDAARSSNVLAALRVLNVLIALSALRRVVEEVEILLADTWL